MVGLSERACEGGEENMHDRVRVGAEKLSVGGPADGRDRHAAQGHPVSTNGHVRIRMPERTV